jgi:hypothetical protein
MRSIGLTRSLIIAVLTGTLMVGVAAPAYAQHYNHGSGGGNHGGNAPSSHWHGGRSYGGNGYHNNSGAIVGGALLGFGLGAILGGVLVVPPPVVYAPPPGYYYRPPPYYVYPYAAPPTVYRGY